MELITFKPVVDIKINKFDLLEYYKSNGIVDFPKLKNGEPHMGMSYNQKQLDLLTKMKKEEMLKKYELYLQDLFNKKQMVMMKQKKEEIERESENCPICYDPLTSMSVLKCGHIFCVTCTISHFRQGDSCPLCRTQICLKPPLKKSVMPLEMSDELITQLLNKDEPERMYASMEKYIENRLKDFKRNSIDSTLLSLEFCNELESIMRDLAESINEWYE
uniref:RING-type domain-containing protein n=1 Tax=viral metagenome TaxID=1070528 RepID=A0A6C0JLM9_9ZZZZ